MTELKVCTWCDGKGEVYPGHSFGGVCGWCDGKGTAWKPNFEGHGGDGDHRSVGPIRAWCGDCGEWCYGDEPCTCCAEVLPTSVDDVSHEGEK